MTPSVSTTPPKAEGAPAHFEAQWRIPSETGPAKAVKRRIGKAWVEPDGAGGWRKRRGKCPDGWFTKASAQVEAQKLVESYDRDQTDRARAVAKASIPTVRKVAWEWHTWKRDVKGATPGTIKNDRYYLLDPGTPNQRGQGTAAGRIMAAFGDTAITDITAKEASAWLRTLDADGMTARNVNLHRQIMHAIFNFAMRADTYGLVGNPFASTDRRAEPPPADLDFYELAEVEALATAAAEGAHRTAPNYRGTAVMPTAGEVMQARWEDAQDATLFRVLFYSGARLGEIRALRWQHVVLADDMSGGLLLIRRSISGGQDVAGVKRSNGRDTPIPRPAAEALDAHRAMQAERLRLPVSPDNYVFCNRYGGAIDDSALRKRYKAACAAAGLRPVKLHGLRHAAGSHVARTSSAMFTRDFLGHTKLATTDRYTHSKMAREGIDTVNRAFGAGDRDDRAKENA